jgi:hypothetical protein
MRQAEHVARMELMDVCKIIDTKSMSKIRRGNRTLDVLPRYKAVHEICTEQAYSSEYSIWEMHFRISLGIPIFLTEVFQLFLYFLDEFGIMP